MFSKKNSNINNNSAATILNSEGSPRGVRISFNIVGSIVKAIKINTTEIIFFVKIVTIFFVKFSNPRIHIKKLPISSAV